MRKGWHDRDAWTPNWYAKPLCCRGCCRGAPARRVLCNPRDPRHHPEIAGRGARPHGRTRAGCSQCKADMRVMQLRHRARLHDGGG